MVSNRLRAILTLLQLVALTLPAILIALDLYMSNVSGIFEYQENLKKDSSQGTFKGINPVLKFAHISVAALVMSGFVLLIGVIWIIGLSFFLAVGSILILFSLSSFGIMIWKMYQYSKSDWDWAT